MHHHVTQLYLIPKLIEKDGRTSFKHSICIVQELIFQVSEALASLNSLTHAMMLIYISNPVTFSNVFFLQESSGLCSLWAPKKRVPNRLSQRKRCRCSIRCSSGIHSVKLCFSCSHYRGREWFCSLYVSFSSSKQSTTISNFVNLKCLDINCV